MSRALPRRGVLAALAAGSALTACPAASAVIPRAPEIHPDADLLAMGERFEALMNEETEADSALQACIDVADARMPREPDALRPQPFDRSAAFWITRQGEFYDSDAVDAFRRITGETIPSRAWRAKVLARAQEVISAHERWLTDCRAVDEACGVPAAERRAMDALHARREFGEAILAHPVQTGAGLAIKAHVALTVIGKEHWRPFALDVMRVGGLA